MIGLGTDEEDVIGICVRGLSGILADINEKNCPRQLCCCNHPLCCCNCPGQLCCGLCKKKTKGVLE